MKNFKVFFILLALSSTLSAINICTDKKVVQEFKNGILSNSIFAKDVYCQGDTLYMILEANNEEAQTLTRLSNQAKNLYYLYLRNQMQLMCRVRDLLVSALKADKGINYTCNIAVVLVYQGQKFYEGKTQDHCQ